MKRFSLLVFVSIVLLLLLPAAQAESVLTLPASTQIIEAEAFYGDTALGKVVLPEGVQRIEAAAFASSSLEEVNLPNSLTFIADDAFDGCEIAMLKVEEGTYAYEWCVSHGLIESGTTSEIPESAHPYLPDTDQRWMYQAEEAYDYLKITFAQETQVEEDYDFLYLYDGADELVGIYTGSELAGRTVIVNGNSFCIRLTSDSEECLYGFAITAIEGFRMEPLVVSVTPGKQDADFNESITWTTEAAGGVAPYTYHYALYQDEVLVDEKANQTSAAYTRKLTERGTYVLKVIVTDAQGNETAAEAAPVVLGPLAIESITASAEWVKIGSVIEWTAEVIGGTSPYTYDFDVYRGENLAVDGQPGESSICSYTVKKPGEFTVKLSVTDAAGTSVSQTSGIVNGYAPIAVNSITANASAVEAGVAVQWNAAVSGGKGQVEYRYTVYRNGEVEAVAANPDGTVFVYAPLAEGIYAVQLTVTDENGETAQLTSAELTVSASTAAETPIEQFTWKQLNGQEASITAYNGTEAVVRIPAEVDGLTITTLASRAFEKNKTLTTVIIPDTITSIDSWVFYECTNLVSVDMGNGLGTIGYSAFYNCYSLKNIEFSNVLEVVDELVFNNCLSLMDVQLPDSITDIGSRAFAGCANLERINIPINWKNVPRDIYNGGIFSECPKLTSIVVPEGITTLPSYAFAYCTYLTDISLPSTLTKINSSAFEGCTGLENIEIPDKVTHIGVCAFDDCKNLSSLNLPEGMQVIDECVFSNCISFTAIKLPDSITDIGSRAFAGCANLERINIPINWKNVPRDIYNGGIFSECPKLTSIVVPEGITTLPSYAFAYCTYLTDISLPSTLTKINSFAFEGCTGLENIEIPDKVTHIGVCAFYNCSTLARLYIPTSVTSIGTDCFENCPNLKIYCEYGSYALQYAIDNSIPYFYLSLTDAWIPSGTLYRGDVYPIRGMVRCSEPIREVTVELYAADGVTLLRSGTVTPGDAYTVNVKQMLDMYINISTLETGTYVYKIHAAGGEETETFATSTFTVVPPPVRVSLSGGVYPTSFVAAGESIAVSGTVGCNYTMTGLTAKLNNTDTAATLLSWNAAPQSTSYTLQALCGTISTAGLPNGNYRFVVTVSANGKQRTVVNASFVLGGASSSASGGEGTGTAEERAALAVKLASDAENRKAFITYTSYNEVFGELGLDDAFNMALNIDYLSEGWNMLVGWFKGHGANESIVRLYKKALVEMIDEKLAPQEEQFTAANTDDFEYVVKFIKESGKITKDSVEKALEGKVVSETVLAGFKDITAIVDTADLLSELPDAIDDAIDIMGILLRDYEGGYRLLISLKENAQNVDAEFEVALNELIAEYSDAYMNSCSQLIDKVIEEATKKGTKAAMELLNVSNFSLKKLAVKLILDLSGSADAADEYKEFFVSVNLHCNLVPSYYSAFDKVAGGDASEWNCENLYNMYVINHEASLRVFDAAIDIADGDLRTKLEKEREQLEALTFATVATEGIYGDALGGGGGGGRI